MQAGPCAAAEARDGQLVAAADVLALGAAVIADRHRHAAPSLGNEDPSVLIGMHRPDGLLGRVATPICCRIWSRQSGELLPL